MGEGWDGRGGGMVEVVGWARWWDGRERQNVGSHDRVSKVEGDVSRCPEFVGRRRVRRDMRMVWCGTRTRECPRYVDDLDACTMIRRFLAVSTVMTT